MIDYKLKWGRVVDTNDPDKKGRIKVSIEPEMENVPEDLLPWTKPFFGTGNSDIMQKRSLKKDTLIHVFCDKYYHNIYYLGQYHVEGFFNFSDITSILNKASEISNKNYDNVEFKLMEDGSLQFNNRSSGDLGIIHNTGSYTIFDNSGNIYIHPNQKKVFIENGSNNLNTILQDIRQIVENLVTPLNLVAPTGPVTYSQVSSDLPKIKLIQTQIDNLLGS